MRFCLTTLFHAMFLFSAEQSGSVAKRRAQSHEEVLGGRLAATTSFTVNRSGKQLEEKLIGEKRLNVMRIMFIFPSFSFVFFICHLITFLAAEKRRSCLLIKIKNTGEGKINKESIIVSSGDLRAVVCIEALLQSWWSCSNIHVTTSGSCLPPITCPMT